MKNYNASMGFAALRGAAIFALVTSSLVGTIPGALAEESTISSSTEATLISTTDVLSNDAIRSINILQTAGIRDLSDIGNQHTKAIVLQALDSTNTISQLASEPKSNQAVPSAHLLLGNNTDLLAGLKQR